MNNAPLAQSSFIAQVFGLSPKKSKSRFLLVDFKNGRHKSDLLLSESRCNLDILPDGLMVTGNFSQGDTIIPILKEEIESITMVRGKEVVDTFFLSPMYILSKLGVPNRVSQYLSIIPWEYRIGETLLTIKCREYRLVLLTNGNRYEKLLRKLKNCGYMDALVLVEKPCTHVLNHSI